jgi:hypothetical protein
MSIELVRQVLDANAFMTIASADAAGVPWATPVWFAHDHYVDLVWVSHPDARHSANVAARPEVGIVVFDSTVAPAAAQGVYLEAVARRVDREDTAFDHLLATYAERSVARGLAAWTADEVTGDAAHRLYVAHATAHFVLDGHDRRTSVDLG